jgi:hypothetical protein
MAAGDPNLRILRGGHDRIGKATSRRLLQVTLPNTGASELRLSVAVSAEETGPRAARRARS